MPPVDVVDAFHVIHIRMNAGVRESVPARARALKAGGEIRERINFIQEKEEQLLSGGQ